LLIEATIQIYDRGVRESRVRQSQTGFIDY
jgi:hypothetical protein